MGRIFCVMGKSASGKDSIYSGVLASGGLPLCRIVPYTTRPMREGEEDGREYMFVDGRRLRELTDAGLVIEQRVYHTIYGDWHYFTVDDGNIDTRRNSYLYIVTLEGYLGLVRYFGKDAVVPIYIEVEDGERLLRAIAREQSRKEPQYEEMCRRFLADARDFSGEKLTEAGIAERFVNRDREETVRRVADYIKERM